MRIKRLPRSSAMPRSTARLGLAWQSEDLARLSNSLFGRFYRKATYLLSSRTLRPHVRRVLRCLLSFLTLSFARMGLALGLNPECYPPSTEFVRLPYVLRASDENARGIFHRETSNSYYSEMRAVDRKYLELNVVMQREAPTDIRNPSSCYL